MLVHKVLIPDDLTDEQRAHAYGIVTIIPTPTGFTMQSTDLSLYWQFDLNKVEHGNDVLHLVRARNGQYVVVWGSDIHESKDSLSSALLRKNIDSFMPLVLIGINEEMSAYTAVFFCHTVEPANSTPTVDNSDESGDMVLKRLMPAIAPVIDRWHAKHKLLKDIKTNDALAALEAQVDLLTELLFSILPADAFPSDKRQKLLDAGVLKMKDGDLAFNDMVAFKTTLRARQATYLATR
ncbi:hypothetical protein BGV57_02915 [Burkholderia ubonensis]|uniref:hypothetical protein n=1 Tax=Burkholderia ubonensis TaxID=101571 RepID=UPI0008FE76F7|nr:hypothetical protein [Burkholderia ubonensis]OJB45838.1 hypothetical protein BGV57_02915 [Burkholderia ubonensis]